MAVDISFSVFHAFMCFHGQRIQYNNPHIPISIFSSLFMSLNHIFLSLSLWMFIISIQYYMISPCYSIHHSEKTPCCLAWKKSVENPHFSPFWYTFDQLYFIVTRHLVWISPTIWIVTELNTNSTNFPDLVFVLFRQDRSQRCHWWEHLSSVGLLNVRFKWNWQFN